jgi:hypothetical protein
MNETPPQPTFSTISVIDPISQAIDRTRDVLFRPVDAGKWMVLGFCAWLAQLADGGGGSTGRSSVNDTDDVRHEFHHAWEWVLDHLVPVVVIGSIVLVMIFALWLLLLWLSSRGKFMFLDGVVNNRAAVVEPWHRHRERGDALFLFRFVIGLVGGFFILGLVLVMLATVWFWAESQLAKPMLILTVSLLVLAVIVVAIVLGLIGLAIEDFLVPLMYLRGYGAGAAWGEFTTLLGSRPGTFVLYVLIRLVVSLVVTLIAVAICCATCCIVLLPYLGTVITLPLWVFKRCYSVYFLSQFGPDYVCIATVEGGPVAPVPEN